MRFWIRSDLHCSLDELAASFDDAPPHDVAVLAGDLAAGLVSQIAAIDSVASRPVVLVAGNHEFWRRSYPAEIEAAEAAAARSRHVRFLERSVVDIAGVRFVGGTLWTDFALFGHDAKSLAMAEAQAGNSDFDLIRNRRGDREAAFTPDDARRIHLETRQVFDDAFAQPFDGPTVVVSHHAPSLRSVGDRWRDDPGTPAYASRLDDQISRWQPDLWIHGHVHDSFDYEIGRTRVICNPAGIGGENGDYDPDLVVEV